MKKASDILDVQLDLFKTDNQKIQLGFLPSMFIMFPLPYENIGLNFTRNYNDKNWMKLSSVHNVPYGKWGRLVMSAIITYYKKNKSSEIDLGSISCFLKSMNKKPAGGERGNISRVTETLKSIWKTIIEIGIYNKNKNEIEVTQYLIAKELKLNWNKGNGRPKQYNNSTIMELTPKFAKYIDDFSVPIHFDFFSQLSSPRDQDIYTWVNRKNWEINKNDEDEYYVQWEYLFMQFWNGIPEDRKRKSDYKIKFKKAIYNIIKHYTSFKYKFYNSGFTIKKSPLFVDSKKNRSYTTT